MRKIRILEHISLDGVIQAPGGPEEDLNGFAYGGWAGPHADAEAGGDIAAAHGDAFDLLLGRRVYDIWSGYWPKAPKGAMADSINAARFFGGDAATRTGANQHESDGIGRHHQHL